MCATAPWYHPKARLASYYPIRHWCIPPVNILSIHPIHSNETQPIMTVTFIITLKLSIICQEIINKRVVFPFGAHDRRAISTIPFFLFFLLNLRLVYNRPVFRHDRPVLETD